MAPILQNYCRRILYYCDHSKSKDGARTSVAPAPHRAPEAPFLGAQCVAGTWMPYMPSEPCCRSISMKHRARHRPKTRRAVPRRGPPHLHHGQARVPGTDVAFAPTMVWHIEPWMAVPVLRPRRGSQVILSSSRYSASPPVTCRPCSPLTIVYTITYRCICSRVR